MVYDWLKINNFVAYFVQTYSVLCYDKKKIVGKIVGFVGLAGE